MEFGYWNYYNDDFKWDFNSDLLLPDYDHTITLLQSNGLTMEEAVKFYRSGYVSFKDQEIIIDRLYGGPLRSYDMCSRFSPREVIGLLNATPKSRISVEKAKSYEELKDIVNAVKKDRNIVLRGQTRNHSITREINNPYFTIPEIGEVSLLPSLWRKMYKQNPHSYDSFCTLSLFEWSNVFFSAFDIDEIERRHQELLNQGQHIYSMSDMEDCDDPLLSKFGKFRMDLAMGMNYNLATTLTTLLQHYGLLSPVLDLTESLEVALFFATHQYKCNNGISSYHFLGSNNKQAVIYLIDYNKNEMEKHNERDEFLSYLEPQRPKAQKCVVSRCGEYSINLPTFYLREMIFLDFDISENVSNLGVKDIFPDKNSDKFLKAISEKLHKTEYVTIFN
ncbi:MAG: FRG domain-containing protein [Bacteroidia bacterium]